MYFKTLTPMEESRTYIFPNNQEITINNVTSIYVRPSGVHCLETIDNKKYIINSGWIAIKIDVAEWTF